jgi:hypothetical protein
MTLETHDARVEYDLSCLNHGGQPWTRPVTRNGDRL